MRIRRAIGGFVGLAVRIAPAVGGTLFLPDRVATGTGIYCFGRF
jgi:hypothetical protein